MLFTAARAWRVSPRALILAALVVALLGTAWGAIVVFRRDARAAERAAELATELKAGLKDTDLLVWAAMANGSIDAARLLDAGNRVNVTYSKLQGLRLEKLRGIGQLLERYDRRSDTYRAAATDQLVALQFGDTARAQGIGKSRSAPSLEAVSATIDRLQAAFQRRAEQRRLAADLTSGAILGIAMLLTVLLYRLKRRAYHWGEIAATRASEMRFRSIVQNSSDTIIVVGVDGRISLATGAVHRTLAREAAELEEQRFVDLVHADDAAAVERMLETAASEPRQTLSAGWRMEGANEVWRDIEAVVSNPDGDESAGGIVLTLRDVSERKRLEEQLRQRAFHDPLTQLANRALFYDRVEHALARRRREGGLVAVLFVDIDDFKLVNDRFGHVVGDAFIVAFATRLRDCVRSSDTAARLGGDEFGILLERLGSPCEPVQAAERVLAALRERLTVEEEPHSVSASIGIALAAGGETADELLRRADLAMYAAKGTGKGGYELFDEDFETGASTADSRDGDRPPERIAWLARNEERREEILSLLDRPGPVRPVFQPIIDLRTGLIAGYEALTRFPGSPLRPPNAWFAQAHRFGLGPRLEAHALSIALRQPGRPEGTFLALNVSPSALASAEVASVLPERLEGLVLEVTENEVVGDDASFRMLIEGLRRRGARLAIDDAGAGHAGLRQLMRLKPDLIKLDRSLVHDAHVDPARAALIEAFVRFATSMGASVCAEGVESLADLIALSQMDVACAQGFVVGRPAEPWAAVSADAVAVCAASFSGASPSIPEGVKWPRVAAVGAFRTSPLPERF